MRPHLKVYHLCALGLTSATVMLSACASLVAPQSVLKQVDLVVKSVTVIDPETQIVQRHRNVYIDDGLIVAVTDQENTELQATSVLDGHGQYLIPGLMDMHVHTAVSFVAEDSFRLLIANGVTGIRDMSGDCWEPQGPIFLCIDQMRAYATAIDKGRVLGPRVLRLSSPLVQSRPTHELPDESNPLYSPSTKAQGRELADYLAQRGVDLIKVYDGISSEAYAGLSERARALGLEFSGHTPFLLGVAASLQAGQTTIEHAKDLIYDCSAHGPVYRRAMQAVVNGTENAAWPDDDELLSKSVDEFDPVRCAAILQAFVRHHAYYVPTHGTREMDARASDPEYRNDARLKYISPEHLADWSRDLNRTAAAPKSRIDLYHAFYQHGLMVTKLAVDAGVNVMLGTDANDTMIIPGFGVHDELRRFVGAGLTPMQALRSATTVPAQYLGLSDRFGGISSGKRADLVLLSADPLMNIDNTIAIRAVIFNGQIIDRPQLDTLLEQVAHR